LFEIAWRGVALLAWRRPDFQCFTHPFDEYNAIESRSHQSRFPPPQSLDDANFFNLAVTFISSCTLQVETPPNPYNRTPKVFQREKRIFQFLSIFVRRYQRRKRSYCRCRRPPLHVRSPCIPCRLLEKQDLDRPRPRPSSRHSARERCQIRKHQDHGRICSNDFRFHERNTRDQVESSGEGIPQDCSGSCRKSPQCNFIKSKETDWSRRASEVGGDGLILSNHIGRVLITRPAIYSHTVLHEQTPP
jgi:hypothetical protein